MREEELNNLSAVFNNMDIILNLRAHLRQATDCGFLYWHKVQYFFFLKIFIFLSYFILDSIEIGSLFFIMRKKISTIFINFS